MDIAVVEFDLLEVVEASTEALSFKAREKRVRLLAHVDPRLPCGCWETPDASARCS
jgi:hypothetical protein